MKCFHGITEQVPRCQAEASAGSDYCLKHTTEAQACVVRFCYHTTNGPLCPTHEKEYRAVRRDRFGLADFCQARKGWQEETTKRELYTRGDTH